eukprot:790186-Pyramimonas_sp.AAC.1
MQGTRFSKGRERGGDDYNAKPPRVEIDRIGAKQRPEKAATLLHTRIAWRSRVRTCSSVRVYASASRTLS